MLPCHFFLTTTTINHPTTIHHTKSMPPRTRADDKASRSGHVHTHTPVRKQGPSNAGNQATKCQKKHQEDLEEPAQPESTNEEMKGTKMGKKGKGGKEAKAKRVKKPRKTSAQKAVEDASQAPPTKLTP
ncbi:uncharacterized protein LACBIDRAFT_335869 [Laccaria bicolor S238N-H82]|uniref:Predicted protein n=1 Tax=Laccaria bicolor (strain S238N-H82 / ATCC MYA-4686) TaxID=486041 RepID=B0E3P3_LACBS|nr:uncharacterized protein LACBIDRAFT_335869 [Laccaria bicolor S238N-H82]EDQ98542.1 predicted protein [Laccaria bicolor S238N-H82]|eukprot:XP_001890811.1 predicted protein [Laccaria bicolor S238N-H82]